MFQTGASQRVKCQHIKKITTGCKDLDSMIGGATNTLKPSGAAPRWFGFSLRGVH